MKWYILFCSIFIGCHAMQPDESIESLSIKLQQLHIALVYESGRHAGYETRNIVQQYLPLLQLDPRTLPATEKERRKMGLSKKKKRVRKEVFLG